MTDKKIIITFKIIIIAIASFIVITALYGGLHLILDPSGKSINLDIYLESVFFVKDYKALGIILIFAIGLLHFISAALLLANNNLTGIVIIISASVLLVWTCVQLFTIGWFYHSILYFILSILEILLGIIYWVLLKKYVSNIR